MRIKIFYPEVYNIARFGKKRKEYPPFGILYLAAILEKMGQDVQLQAITPESDISFNPEFLHFSLCI